MMIVNINFTRGAMNGAMATIQNFKYHETIGILTKIHTIISSIDETIALKRSKHTCKVLNGTCKSKPPTKMIYDLHRSTPLNENFQIETLATTQNKKEANKLEDEHISYFGTTMDTIT